MCSIKRAKLRNKTKKPFPPFPPHSRWSKLKLKANICKIIKMWCAVFVYFDKISMSKISNCNFFTTNKKFNERHIKILFFLQNFNIFFDLSLVEWKGKGGNGTQILPILVKNWPFLMSKLAQTWCSSMWF